LPSLAGKRGKNLTATLTFVLSRRGREKMKGKILKDPSPLPSPAECGCVVIRFLFENFID
jgi:hypothetical protein